MLFIQFAEITPALTALFNTTEPTIPRAWNVLEGTARGRIVTDDATHSSWAVVQDAVFGTLYCGGRMTQDVLASVVEHLRQLGDVGIGYWPDSELSAMLPPEPDYDGRTLYFTERSADVPLAPLVAQLPTDYRLAIRDAALFAQSFDYASTLAAFGTVEQALRLTYGVVALREGIVCSEAATGAPTHGRIKIGVTTAETHQRRGLASSTCARLIEICEVQGYRTWWDCAKQNTPSVRLARKLGYIVDPEICTTKRPRFGRIGL